MFFKEVWYRFCMQFKENWPVFFVPMLMVIGAIAQLWYLRHRQTRELHSLYKKHEVIGLIFGDAQPTAGYCACGGVLTKDKPGDEWRDEIDRSPLGRTTILGLVWVSRVLIRLTVMADKHDWARRWL
jgi:hypothetical protein